MYHHNHHSYETGLAALLSFFRTGGWCEEICWLSGASDLILLDVPEAELVSPYQSTRDFPRNLKQHIWQ